MNRGFYALSSSMITQSRTLNTIGNNMANSQTNGYKRDTMVTTTFGDMVMNRIDAGSKATFSNAESFDEFASVSEYIDEDSGIHNLVGNRTPLGDVSFFRTSADVAKIHTQGTLIPTERDLDFAIVGSGFFAVKDGEETVYTRTGNFNLDNEGFLVLDGTGRIQGENGDIYVGTDKFGADESGNMLDEDNEVIETIPTYDFENYDDLLTVGEGFYSGENPTLVENPEIWSQTVEGSNVDVGQEMTNQIATQRILQNVSQALKIYDKVLESATTQIGRV